MFRLVRICVMVVIACYLTASNSAAQTKVGPANGTLVLCSLGAAADAAIYQRIVELVGGPDELIVIIPTARGIPTYDESYRFYAAMRKAGARNLLLLHTYDRKVADSEQFVEPLRRARGVIIGGGDQTLLADAYLHTRTHRELDAVLGRGGVIAGNSAGAMMSGSFLARGVKDLPLESPTVIGDHVEGFGWLRDVVVLPHLFAFNRQFDLLRIKKLHLSLLGIGLNDGTAIIVQRDNFEIIGAGPVAIYDRQPAVEPDGNFYFLSVGDSFDLANREAFRGPDRAPLPRVVKKTK